MNCHRKPKDCPDICGWLECTYVRTYRPYSTVFLRVATRNCCIV